MRPEISNNNRTGPDDRPLANSTPVDYICAHSYITSFAEDHVPGQVHAGIYVTEGANVAIMGLLYLLC